MYSNLGKVQDNNKIFDKKLIKCNIEMSNKNLISPGYRQLKL